MIRLPFPCRRTTQATVILVTCGLVARPIGHAQTVNVPGGLPTHVNATYQEPGLGGWTPDTTGTAQATSGSGAVTQTTTAGTSDSDALETLYQQSWGYAAAQNAEALGVNPSALAATCVVESGCQNLYTAGNGSTITGAFQMSNGTYSQTLGEALAADPSLASSITSGTAGQQDPATQAVAAAQYLKDAATSLQHSGISNPTALDARAYYNFGPSAGAEIATADDSNLMSSYISSTAMSGNNISATTTVGQWRAAVAAKMGSAASSSILTG